MFAEYSKGCHHTVFASHIQILSQIFSDLSTINKNYANIPTTLPNMQT